MVAQAGGWSSSVEPTDALEQARIAHEKAQKARACGLVERYLRVNGAPEARFKNPDEVYIFWDNANRPKEDIAQFSAIEGQLQQALSLLGYDKADASGDVSEAKVVHSKTANLDSFCFSVSHDAFDRISTEMTNYRAQQQASTGVGR